MATFVSSKIIQTPKMKSLSAEFLHDNRTIVYWIWLTERERFHSVWAVGLKN